MPAIHLIEKSSSLQRMLDAPEEWESGHWVVGDDAAQRLVGGSIFLHTAQAEPSHFGGTILSYRRQKDGNDDGKVIFRFHALRSHKDVTTSRDGWGVEKKFNWDEDGE